MNQQYKTIKKFIVKEEDQNLDSEWINSNLDNLVEDLIQLYLEQPKTSIYLCFYIIKNLDRFNRLRFFNLIIDGITESILDNIEGIPNIVSWDFAIDLLEDYLVNTTSNYSRRVSSIILNLIIETLKQNQDPTLKEILTKLDKTHNIHKAIYELWGVDEYEYFNKTQSIPHSSLVN